MIDTDSFWSHGHMVYLADRSTLHKVSRDHCGATIGYIMPMTAQLIALANLQTSTSRLALSYSSAYPCIRFNVVNEQRLDIFILTAIRTLASQKFSSVKQEAPALEHSLNEDSSGVYTPAELKDENINIVPNPSERFRSRQMLVLICQT